jgi:hypothetical protein
MSKQDIFIIQHWLTLQFNDINSQTSLKAIEHMVLSVLSLKLHKENSIIRRRNII